MREEIYHQGTKTPRGQREGIFGCHHSRPFRGFTLIELLSVIAVMILIMALVVPAFRSVGRSTNLTSGVNMVVDQLNLARQTSLSQNRLVEVRFYILPGSTGGTSSMAYRAVRMYIYDATGVTATAVSGVKYLPTGAIMVADAAGTFTSLLPTPNGTSTPTANTATTTLLRPTTGQENLPGAANTNYAAFQFRPSGGTSLDQNGPGNGDKWFVSFKLEVDPVPAGNTKPAANFITALIDPVSGRVRTFRPG